MRKRYMTPECEINLAEAQAILADSKSVSGDLNGKFEIGFGGEDTDGTLDPSSNTWGINNWDTLDN